MYGKILKAFRLANLMSLEEFASYIEISKIYLGELERGVKTNLSNKLLDNILINLNISKEFFSGLINYAESLEKTLGLHNDLSLEDKERYFMQEILFLILNNYHEQTLKTSFIEKKRNKY